MFQGQNFLWQQRQQLQLQQMQQQLALQQQRAAERRQQQQAQAQAQQRQQQRQQPALQTASPQLQAAQQGRAAVPQQQQSVQQPRQPQQPQQQPAQQQAKPPASPVHPVGAPGARGLHVGLQSPPPAAGARPHRPFARSKTATAPRSTGEAWGSGDDAAASGASSAASSGSADEAAEETVSDGEADESEADAASAVHESAAVHESPADSPVPVASPAASPLVASTSSSLPEVQRDEDASPVTQQTSASSFRRPSLAELSPGASPHTTEWSAYRLGTRNFGDDSPSPGVASGHRPPLPLMHSRLKPHGGVYDPTGSHVQRPETTPAPRVPGYDSGILAARVKQLEDEIVHLRRELQDEKVTSAVVIQNQQQDILRMQQLIDQCVGPCRNLLDVAARAHDRMR